MLRRFYVDNFRCLVNFELKLDRVNLLLGGNGTGKTAVFDVLHRLRQFVGGNGLRVLSVFPSSELTRWQNNGVQRFELDVQIDGDLYAYSLVIQHDDERRKACIKRESLLIGGNSLFDFQEGLVRLYQDDFQAGPQYPFDSTQSGLGVLQPRGDNKKLTRFRNELEKIIVVAFHPQHMSGESRQEERVLSRNLENFASWYRYLSQEHQGAVPVTFQELKKVLPGFSSCSLKEAGEAKLMKVLFERPDNGGRAVAYDLKELSDGQRVLIALHSLLFGLKDEGVSLFLDEPDNFVALREIQPWLAALTDLCGHGIEQAVVISHHPEIINYLAASKGRWFDRESNGPARVSDQAPSLPEGLTTAESIARGWTS
jgi:predicted ATPase